MLAEERQQHILQMLKENNVVKLQEIREQTNCSESSARRDLQLLEEKGLLVRVHGGAKIKHSLQRELDMSGKASKNTAQKEAIAKAAAKLVEAEDVIYLDAGTTTLAMISYLNKPELTVVTNGVMHASLLADQNVRTILIGGELKNTTKAIIGVKAVSSLTQFRFNKAFLGINGIHPRYGFTTPDPDEAAVKTTALEQSEECFVLADPSKFDNVSFVKVAELSQATIITSSLSQPVRARYREQTTIQEDF
ncbi:DeoR/GlpR family DNA-binding transcription regulator [Ligilactobacillus animalis]|uniref:DeoR/GlpR family DNA-binding transcription regulator n=1 Tax=Ligilactobacillus animalis TaxID=1605 RepID=UPI002592805B|nr:DeoR/GlpR family DNA-binding transcription regulator [Ligilactobacillus animalis]